MGLFDKLFSKKNKKEQTLHTPSEQYNLQITSEKLSEDLFWQIVDESTSKTNSIEKQEFYLTKQIEKLTPKEIIGFRLRTDKLLFDTYNSEMWCAGYIMNGGCSDDGFEYFRNWIISLGKEKYFKAKDNPDSLISEYQEGTEFYEFEGFWYVALAAFKNKTGKDLYDYIGEDFKTSEGNYPNFDFNWSEEKPESMRKICPQLYDKMWN